MTIEVGAQLDQYRLVEKIGEGGMGVVWKARDTSLDRDVAIKVLPESFLRDQGRLARFEREAKAVAALSHPNIVAIYGFGTAPGGAYAAMELLEGQTLGDLLEDGALPPRKAVDIARQIAVGLDAAHGKGIVHRDLKPDNVIVTPDGRARILDFGLAATSTGADSNTAGRDLATRTELTNPGAVMGTVGYMSPEQVRAQAADSRSDIFSLGVMLYEMLAGKKPFGRSTQVETMTAILREDAPDVAVGEGLLPPALARVVRRCLEKGPDERFQSARDLAFALDNAILDSSASLPVGPAVEVPAPARSRTAALWAIALLAMVGAFAAGRLARKPSAPADVPRVTQLTFSGSDHQPDVSPDGQLVAFTSARRGVSQIWLRQVGGGGEQPLTDGPDMRPRFSPDGTSVAFIRNVGGVYSALRVPVLGGQPRRLIADVVEVDWAPDGSRLAFVHTGFIDQVAGAELGVLDIASGETSIVVRAQGWSLKGLNWSPDGRRLVATKASSTGGQGKWRLLVVDPVAGTHEELVVDGGSLLSPAIWSGRDTLIYARSPTTVSGSARPDPIVRFDLGTRQERILAWAPYLFPARNASLATTRICILGDDRLLFDTFRTVQTITQYDRSTGTSRILAEGVSADRQPAYAPDGGRLLFTSNRSGNVDLFAYDFAAERLTQLTEHEGNDWDGAYSPDGRSIVWSSDRSGNLEIWIADADGANPRQVSWDGVDAENPTMTADGQWIVYSSGAPDHPGIYKVRPDGTDTTPVVPGTWTNPEVSPDGHHVLYSRRGQAQPRAEIRIAEIATGRQLDFEIVIDYDTNSPNVTFGRGRWLPAGDAIAFVGVDELRRVRIFVQDFVPGRDTTDTRRPLMDVTDGSIAESLGLAPDGERFAISTFRQVSALNVIDGLGSLR